MGVWDKLYIAKTKYVNKGLFAKKRIKKDEVIFLLKGALVRSPYIPNHKVGSRWIGVGRNLWINSSRNNPGYFINHSCSPNAGFKGRVTLVAMREIRRGEEITYDYSIAEEDLYWSMECKCRKKNCRKIIKSIQHLPAKIFKRYRQHIPPFFQRSYIQSCKRNELSSATCSAKSDRNNKKINRNRLPQLWA